MFLIFKHALLTGLINIGTSKLGRVSPEYNERQQGLLALAFLTAEGKRSAASFRVSFRNCRRDERAFTFTQCNAIVGTGETAIKLRVASLFGVAHPKGMQLFFKCSELRKTLP